MNVRRIFTLAGRVFKQIVGDGRTLALIFLAPIIILSLAGVLLKSSPKNIALGVVNEDEGVEAAPPLGHVSLAAFIVDELRNGDTFAVTELAREEVEAALRAGRIEGAVLFAPDFSQALGGGGQTRVECVWKAPIPPRRAISATT